MTVDPARTIVFTTCELHRSHWPRPLVAQLHHSFPQYLQAKALAISETELQHDPRFDRSTIPVCGTGHDTIHELVRALLRGETITRRTRESTWAQYAVDHYHAAGGK